ncbi:type I 3-dehydroquinate dehydratase [Thermodesulfovibrio sp. 3907-1M]|uniref:3-dehydroquinate dehydratase n=1 Tax=Thermodesulfovibrio autotrophicus TaxID=3118333 RepID=A0AAU8GUN5_9BACT
MLNLNMLLKNIPAIAVVLNDRDVLSLKENSLKDTDLIELRVDMFENLMEVENIFNTARKKFNLPLICTIRSPQEGGMIDIPDRLSIYFKMIPFCDFFDIEIFSDEAGALRELSLKNNIKLIGSYHRFDTTPSTEELERVFEKGFNLGVDIIKIATMVNEREDIERLSLFLLNHRKNNIIVIGMGKKGRLTRVIFPALGSLITYASLNISSAPGQISLQDMVDIFRKLDLRD